MIKDRIIFFASGDFAIDTLYSLIENDANVVGVVTSMDKVEFHPYHIADVAKSYNIPLYIVKGGIPMEKDGFFMDWLRRANGDVFCVISFKKLPNEVIKLAKKCAFNVHASLLPFLKGAAPINWAIRLGYKYTGLTAFVLNNKIDSGDIIANTKIDVKENEKFTSLFKRLSDLCVDFTKEIIENHLQKDNWRDYLIKQPIPSDSYDYISVASKINQDYFKKAHWIRFYANEFKHCVDSVDNIGFDCRIIVHDKILGKEKEIPIKIYDVDVVGSKDVSYDQLDATETDGKTYIRINLGGGSAVNVTELQIIGKKKMDVKTFLNGFRYFNDDKYMTYITDYME